MKYWLVKIGIPLLDYEIIPKMLGITLYHIILYHIILYYIRSYSITLYHITCILSSLVLLWILHFSMIMQGAAPANAKLGARFNSFMSPLVYGIHMYIYGLSMAYPYIYIYI